MSREASYYKKNGRNATECGLCPNRCVTFPGSFGLCGSRKNEGGVLKAWGYGIVSSAALDPIEKKPLKKFLPGGMIFSIGGYGCNLKCAFCQNHSISTKKPDLSKDKLTPDDLADIASRLVSSGNVGVAYTYNEPLINIEYVSDCAARVKERGLSNVLVTNGYVNAEPLWDLLPLIDALNIDLKSFNDSFYREIGGSLSEVLGTIESAAQATHVEITTLIIPGLNDGEDEMDSLASFIRGVDRAIPLHLTRFAPKHKLTDVPPTPKDTILRLAEIAKNKLDYVYVGNF